MSLSDQRSGSEGGKEEKPVAIAPETGVADTSSKSWSDMGPRLISAFVLLSITIFMVWAGGIWFALLVALAFAGGLREWEAMIGVRQNKPFGMFLIALMAFVPIVSTYWGISAGAMFGVAGAVVSLFGRAEFRMWRAGGFLFFTAVIIALLSIRGAVALGFAACFFLGATVWMTDTGALLAGRVFRGAKLNPEISPAKTWSGAIGGLIVGTLSGLFVWVLVSPSSWWIGALIAAAVSFSGQLGDLSESAIKRHFRIKDSGDSIPGHGGLLDRIDSLTFGALLLFLVGAINAGPQFVSAGILFWNL